MHRKWLFAVLVVTCMGLLLVGFNANPSPKPQRVSDLVARIEALEEENGAQQEALDALAARVETIEQQSGTSTLILDEDVIFPRGWVQDDTSDGIVRYRHDPDWELARDEPGTMDLWLDEDTAIFFAWDWAYDLVSDLYDDEEFLRIFEGDMFGSDETIRMDMVESGEVRFMGKSAYFWELHVENVDGYSSRMLTIFYPCSDLTSCSLTYVRFDPDPEDDAEVDEFDQDDWRFLNTFAHGVEFPTEGKPTVTANANLRACPSTSCEVVGHLLRGAVVEVVAISEDGQWYQLESGEWVYASLVFGAPLDLPTVRDDGDI